MINPYEKYDMDELCGMVEELDFEIEAAKCVQREIEEKLFWLNHKKTMISQEIAGGSTSEWCFG